jgi:hypothetical protein
VARAAGNVQATRGKGGSRRWSGGGSITAAAQCSAPAAGGRNGEE